MLPPSSHGYVDDKDEWKWINQEGVPKPHPEISGYTLGLIWRWKSFLPTLDWIVSGVEPIVLSMTVLMYGMAP